MEDKFQKEIKNKSQNFDEEIDLNLFINLINRNKLFITTITFTFFILFSIYSILKTKTWKGSFQIVLSGNNNIPVVQSTFASLASRIRGNSLSGSIATEVGILESPSVLMPVFEYVNTKNKILDPNANDLIFANWKKNNLKITLQEGTAILNISYTNSNKKEILPVLSKISNEYQKYSGKKRERKIQLRKKYLENQISIYKSKSSVSIKKAQEYAIDQDLIFLAREDTFNPNTANLNKLIKQEDNLFNSDDLNNQDFLLTNVNIENIRVKAANDLRRIDLQIKKINSLDQKDYETLQYFGLTIPALTYDQLPQKLKAIDTKLFELKSKYTDKDKSVISLLKQKDLTTEMLKSRAIKYLKIAKLETEAKLEAAMRPKGVISKYKELVREANRDENTLIRLENELRTELLREAELNDPWQLITKPTLNNKALGPGKKEIAFYGLILGSIFAIIITYLKEYQTGLIFEKKSLEKILNSKIISEIDLENKKSIQNSTDYIRELLNLNGFKKVRFISLALNEKFLEDIKRKFESLDKNIQISKDFFNLRDDEMNIFLTSSTFESKKDLIIFKNNLGMLRKKINGILLIIKN